MNHQSLNKVDIDITENEQNIINLKSSAYLKRGCISVENKRICSNWKNAQFPGAMSINSDASKSEEY